LGQPLDLFDDTFGDMFSGAVLQSEQHPKAGSAFHQRCHLRLGIGTDDQVSFPMPRHSPVCHLSRPLRYVDHVFDLAVC
jgi:hypothetical protein